MNCFEIKFSVLVLWRIICHSFELVYNNVVSFIFFFFCGGNTWNIFCFSFFYFLGDDEKISFVVLFFVSFVLHILVLTLEETGIY